MPELSENKALIDQTIGTTVTFVVNLIDAYSGRQPIGKVNVSIKDQDVKTVKNPSGYHVFTNLPIKDYHVRVQSDFYFEEEAVVEVSQLDPHSPVWDIRLNPLPSYPFPAGATLIRGMVRTLDDKPEAKAKVEVLYIDCSNFTNEKGEFVLYFKGLTNDDVDTVEGKQFIKVDGSTTLYLEAHHGSRTGLLELEQVEEGQSTSTGMPIFLYQE